MKKTSLMRRIYDSRTFWLIVSLLASVMIWVYVTGMESDVYSSTFRGVRVELVGEDTLRAKKNMVVTDLDTSTVTVVVSGPRRVVSSLSASDLVAEVDVSKLTQPIYTSQPYTIVYPTGTDTTGLRETAKSPQVVNFMVSELTSKVIPVRGSFDGMLAEGYTGEAPVFDPATITVTGAEVYLKNISYAWVIFGENQKDIDTSYHEETSYQLMTEEGEECSAKGLQFSAESVTASVPILQAKEIPLSVKLIFGPAETEDNVRVTFSPDSIMLAGDSGILSGINTIVLDTIDLSTFEYNYSGDYPIPFDSSLKNLSGVTEAKVTVELQGLETRAFRVSNISCANVTEGYTAEILTENIDVRLRGTPEELDQIKSESIRAVADLKDYNETTGAMLPMVKISVDGSTNVSPIGSYTASVVIKRGE